MLGIIITFGAMVTAIVFGMNGGIGCGAVVMLVLNERSDKSQTEDNANRIGLGQ